MTDKLSSPQGLTLCGPKNKVETDCRRINVFLPPTSTPLTPHWLSVPGPPPQQILSFLVPLNDRDFVCPCMNPLGLLQLPSTTVPNDHTLRCHQCRLRPFWRRRCNSILDRRLQLYGYPLARFDGPIPPISPQHDQVCKPPPSRESIHPRFPSPNHYPSG